MILRQFKTSVKEDVMSYFSKKFYSIDGIWGKILHGKVKVLTFRLVLKMRDITFNKFLRLNIKKYLKLYIRKFVWENLIQLLKF